MCFVNKMRDKPTTKNVANVSLEKKNKKKTATYEIIILSTICTGVELDLAY